MKKKPGHLPHETEKKTLKGTRFLWLGNLVLLVTVVVVILHWGDWRVFVKLLAQAKLGWLGIALLFQIGTYTCVTLIWKVVLERCNISIPTRNLFALSIAKLFSDQTIPSFGLSGSVVAMRGFIKRKSSKGAAAAAVIMNTAGRYIPYFILFCVALAILWDNHMLNKGLQYMAIIFSIAVGILTVLALTLIELTVSKKTPAWMHRIRWLDSALKMIQDIPQDILKSKRLWLVAALANTGIFLLDASTLWALLCSLGRLSHLWVHSYASFMISSAVTDIAIVPGRIGVFEGSSITLLHLFNIPLEEAVAAIVLFRGFTYWLPMIPGFIITRREFRKK